MTSETEEKANPKTMPEESKSRSMEDAVKKMSAAAEQLQAFSKPVFEAFTLAIPHLIKYGRLAKQFWDKLPQNAINFIIGFVFCFFGGLYPVLFAAIQAAEHGGRKQVMEALSALANEATVIIEESKKDDKADDDKDGVSDVNQMASKEFVRRKTLLVLRKMNPNKVDTAVSKIYKVWMAVAAVLTIEFARVISLALALAEFIKRPVYHYIAPVVKQVVPREYDKWVPVILGWICKSIAMSVAWYIQTIRSAFTSALIGGLMMARSACIALRKRGITLGGLIKDDNKDTMADEYLSYIFATLGFIFQFMLGFDVPFPFNLLLWPFELAEVFIRWSITTGPK